MSSTNSTSHYNLPQFVSTDKPAWLTDINGAMSAIDTGIYEAKTTADTASTAAGNADTKAETAQTTANTAITNAGAAQSTADGNSSKIGTLASLDTSAKSDLVSAINEVNTAAGTAQSTATEGKTLAESLAAFVNINTYQSWSNTSKFSRREGTGSCTYANFNVATNQDKSLAKIYGQITVGSTGTGGVRWKLTEDTGLRPTSQITVRGISFLNGNNGKTSAGNVYINTDGTIELEAYNDGATQFNFDCIACVLWIKDFGDTSA